MSHYANVIDGKVIQVIVAEQEVIDEFMKQFAGDWIQCSYNTRGGIHYGQDGQPDGGIALRANYPGIGYTYDADLDAFIPPQPYPSWTLTEACQWEAPTPYPTDGKVYTWDEATTSWVEVPVGE